MCETRRYTPVVRVIPSLYETRRRGVGNNRRDECFLIVVFGLVIAERRRVRYARIAPTSPNVMHFITRLTCVNHVECRIIPRPRNHSQSSRPVEASRVSRDDIETANDDCAGVVMSQRSTPGRDVIFIISRMHRGIRRKSRSRRLSERVHTRC